MNFLNIYLHLWSTMMLSTWVYGYNTTDYINEIHIHGKHYVINITCLNQTPERNNHKRSLSPNRTYNSDVRSSQIHVVYETQMNVAQHQSQNSLTQDIVKKERGLIRKDTDKKMSDTNIDPKHSDSYSTTLLRINCDWLEINSTTVNSSGPSLRIKSHGTLQLTPDWAQNLTDVESLTIKSDNGLILPSECSWIPLSINELKLSYTPLNSFTLRNCTSSLRRLELQGTRLQNLSVCVESLEELDASWNILKGELVLPECPQMAQNLRQLKLHNNELSSWFPCNWPSLTHLELQNNNLQDIQFSSCPLRHLFHLDLSYNKLAKMPLPYPSKLSFLSLSNNHLKQLSHFNHAIQEVDLSHNELKIIGKGIFRSASSLLSLDLSRNHLTTIYGHDFTGLRSLRYLDLSFNEISHIRHEALLPLRQIQELRINNNKIQQLDTRLLAKLPRNLLHFNVNDNLWQCSCHLLASLSRASRLSCKENCRKMSELTCHTGTTVVLAQDLLRRCIEAQETETQQPIYLIPSKQNSDEDTSEEKGTDTSGASIYYAIIPIAVLIFVIPVMGFGMKKLYLSRKRLLKSCSCLSPSSSDVGSSNAQWSTQFTHRDSDDSETEF